jgi:translation initiation factor IF-1
LAKEDVIKMAGVVDEVLPSATFRVRLEDSKQLILAYLGGKMRQHSIEILAGDRVEVEMSVYDLSRGRIVYRHK